MPLQATSGAASYDAFGGGAAAVTNYIEDVFSTWMVTPTSSNTTYSVTNGIDVSGKGGMVWMKSRSSAGNNLVYDTARGASAGSNNALITNSTSAQQTANFDYITGLSNGFTVNFATGGGQLTNNGINYVSWTFREQPKFFDVVTWTGTGSNTTIAHNLGSVPGCIIVKRTDTTANWAVYHRSLANTEYLVLNTRDPVTAGATWWNSTTPTSAVFSVGTDASVNASGGTYVAYIYAHDAGGFGLTATDNVISCGSYTTNGSGAATVNLGYEPQFVLEKSTGTSSWWLSDTMRGMSETNDIGLFPNSSAAESSVGSAYIVPKATGFDVAGHGGSATYIYIAIRRGPMKVPTVGTSVFSPNLETTSTNPQTLTTGFPVDLSILTVTTGTNRQVSDRLRGGSTSSFTYLLTDSTAAEVTYSGFGLGYDNNTGIVDSSTLNQPNAILWNFRRAPSFFDEVCYTGTGSDITLNHNLTVAPELVILKYRTPNPGAPLNYWLVGSGFTSTTFIRNWLQLTNAGTSFAYTSGAGFSAQPTTTTLTVSSGWSQSATTYVAYLFATCAGVSKVGSYTGNGTTQTIDCGFTGGARFVLIKRTDTTGDWYVYDTARGMTVLTDPYLLLNSSAAQTATLGSVTTVTTGFALNSAILAAINVSGGTYIFLAIA
jgi:hypothetical protein